MALDQPGMERIVHADIQDRAGSAPVGVFRGGSHRKQRVGSEKGEHRVEIGHVAGRQRVHGVKIQRHRWRHRHVEPDQPLQAFRPPAMALGRDPRGGRDLGEPGNLRQA